MAAPAPGRWLWPWLWLCGCARLAPGLSDDVRISAPPELVAMVPAAVEATVAAGRVHRTTTAPLLLVPAPASSSSPATDTGSSPAPARAPADAVLIVGDTRYAWREWSAWHCNCAAGSMSRVRDISYAVPGVRLDPAQYDVLRFQRQVCSYAACGCSRAQRQCDRLEVACAKVPAHLCALEDIQRDQEAQRRRFWARVHDGLERLWGAVQETFRTPQQSTQTKTKQ